MLSLPILSVLRCFDCPLPLCVPVDPSLARADEVYVDVSHRCQSVTGYKGETGRARRVKMVNAYLGTNQEFQNLVFIAYEYVLPVYHTSNIFSLPISYWVSFNLRLHCQPRKVAVLFFHNLHWTLFLPCRPYVFPPLSPPNTFQGLLQPKRPWRPDRLHPHRWLDGFEDGIPKPGDCVWLNRRQ